MDSCLLQDSPATAAARYVRFGPFHIDQQRQQVFLDSAPLRLRGKVYQILVGMLLGATAATYWITHIA